MEKISLSIAEKLLLLRNGERIQASRLRQAVFQELLSENILYKIGRARGVVVLINRKQFDLYLLNQYSISDLDAYITVLRRQNTFRSDQVKVSSDSKLTKKRSFKGFLVNCYDPVSVWLNQQQIQLQPIPGLFHFVYDFETFIPEPSLTIVGIENPENFRYIEKQKHLFAHLTPLFISRYPQRQHADVIHWLKTIPNPYLHFGDFDLASINIYQNEYKKHIPEKSTFFIPENIEQQIRKYGNYTRYDRQQLHVNLATIQEDNLLHLIEIIHRHKKGLDQEALIQGLVGLYLTKPK